MRYPARVDYAGKSKALLVEELEELRHQVAHLKRGPAVIRAMEQSAAAVVITDADGVISYVNPAFCAITGYTEEEVIGANPRLLKSGTTPAEVYERMWKTLVQGAVWRGELQNRRKDGSLFWERAIISRVANEDGTVTHFVAVKEDITQRKEHEAQRETFLKDLGRQREELRVLAVLLENTEANARRQIAWQLHDDVAQQLTAISLGLQLVQVTSTEEAVQEQIGKLMHLVAETTRPVRTLMTALLPPQLEAQGLAVALSEYTAQVSSQLHIPIDVDDTEFEGRLEPNVERGLFRIAQEALVNMVKHAEAKTVCIRLQRTASLLTMSVIDDGKGFDQSQVRPGLGTDETAPDGGWGLNIMKGRARALDARFRVDSSVGEGTCVVVELDLIVLEPTEV